MTGPQRTPGVVFAENGASWYWLLAGPGAGLAMLLIQLNSGLGVQWVVPVAFFVLVTGFLGLQIKAARIHTSVELTPEALRQGTETILVDEIVSVYPEARTPPRRVSSENALTRRAMRRAGFDADELGRDELGRDEPDRDEPGRDEPGRGAGDFGYTDTDDGTDDDAATVLKWQSARAIGELTGVPRGRTGIGLALTGGRTAQAWARHHRELRAALGGLVEARRTAGPQTGDPA